MNHLWNSPLGTGQKIIIIIYLPLPHDLQYAGEGISRLATICRKLTAQLTANGSACRKDVLFILVCVIFRKKKVLYH